MASDNKPLKPRKTGTNRKIAGRTGPSRKDETSDAAPDNSAAADPIAGPVDDERPGRAAVAGTPEGERGDEPTTASDTGTTAGRTRSRNLSVLVPATAMVVGLVAGIAGLYLAVNGQPEPENVAFVDTETTDEVIQLAARQAQRLVAIDYTELDAYHDSLDEFLAPNLVEELDRTWDALRDTYEQTRTTVDAQAQNVGLSFLTEDRAEVLLVLSVSMARDGVASGSTTGTYLVELTRIDDTWKLSRIPDLPS